MFHFSRACIFASFLLFPQTELSLFLLPDRLHLPSPLPCLSWFQILFIRSAALDFSIGNSEYLLCFLLFLFRYDFYTSVRIGSMEILVLGFAFHIWLPMRSDGQAGSTQLSGYSGPWDPQEYDIKFWFCSNH